MMKFPPSMEDLEAGSQCSVRLGTDDIVTKLSRVTLSSRSAAEASCADLAAYADELEKQPLPVARLLDVRPVMSAEDERYHVQQTMEYIDGPSLWDIDRSARHEPLAKIIGNIAAAAEGPRQHTLATPVDAHSDNFRVRAGTPVLVDLYPSYEWTPDGTVCRRGPLPSARSAERLQWAGSKPDIIANLLMEAALVFPVPSLAPDDLLAWRDIYGQALPADIQPSLEAAVYKQLVGK